jgi:hypothetical protein
LAAAAVASTLALLLLSDFAPTPMDVASADGESRQEVRGTVASMRQSTNGVIVVLQDASGSASIFCRSEGMGAGLTVGCLASATVTGASGDGLLFASSVRPL